MEKGDGELKPTEERWKMKGDRERVKGDQKLREIGENREAR